LKQELDRREGIRITLFLLIIIIISTGGKGERLLRNCLN
jgi:hypothetical protein